MAADLKDPDCWRFRAEEVLNIAEDLEHEDARAIMRRRNALVIVSDARKWSKRNENAIKNSFGVRFWPKADTG